MDDNDPFGSYGLLPILPEHKPVFDHAFQCCTTRLSDYSFANTFIWRDSIRLRWRMLHDRLCVFANGDGLTLLFAPLGAGSLPAAAAEAVDICRTYNASIGRPEITRVEYVSAEISEQLAPCGYDIEPMSGDYVYETRRMIDLDGPDLASKRQGRNRFARRYEPRCEVYAPSHLETCLRLLGMWRYQHEQTDATADSTACYKRLREELAAAEALRHAEALHLRGMVLYAGDQPVGFTLGEHLGEDACSILVEKADRTFAGSAQYIFSEFCRREWADTRWCNAGDDWDVESLAYTKRSYRPAMRLAKYVLRPRARTAVAVGLPPAPRADAVTVGPAELTDLDALCRLESATFPPELAIRRRQLRLLLRNPRASTHLLRQDGRVAAEAIILRRRTPRGTVARLYSLAVDSACRGRGLGRMLLDVCLDALRAEGLPAVLLEVDERNAAAIALYRKAGFVMVRRVADYYGPGLPALKMRLDLAGRPRCEPLAQRAVANGRRPEARKAEG